MFRQEVIMNRTLRSTEEHQFLQVLVQKIQEQTAPLPEDHLLTVRGHPTQKEKVLLQGANLRIPPRNHLLHRRNQINEDNFCNFVSLV